MSNIIRRLREVLNVPSFHDPSDAMAALERGDTKPAVELLGRIARDMEERVKAHKAYARDILEVLLELKHRPCASKGCPNHADVCPVINVPAVGHEIGKHNPIQCMFGLELCEKCLGEVKAEQFLGPELDKHPQNMRKVISIMARGRAAPDFDRAFITASRIGSPEHEAWKQAIAPKK